MVGLFVNSSPAALVGPGSKFIIVLRAGQAGGFKALSNFKSLHRSDGENSLGQIGVQLVKHRLADACREACPDMALEELSMGMSEDFEAALMEGSTLIRLGRVVFDPAFVL